MINRTHQFDGVARCARALLLALAVSSTGCATYAGSARSAQPALIAREGGWLMVPEFPLVRQEKSDDCGAAALAAVLRFWGRSATPRSIETAIGHTSNRLLAGDMVEYARKQGLHSYVFFGNVADIVHELERGRPVIVGLGKAFEANKALAHYEVVVGYQPKQERVLMLDPGSGWQVDNLKGFTEEWARSKGVTIVTFLPPPDARLSGK